MVKIPQTFIFIKPLATSDGNGKTIFYKKGDVIHGFFELPADGEKYNGNNDFRITTKSGSDDIVVPASTVNFCPLGICPKTGNRLFAAILLFVLALVVLRLLRLI